MTKIKAVVIDDEPKSRQVLMELVSMFCPEIEIIGEAGTINGGVKAIHELKPQLVFFDILLQEGDSFEIIKQVNEVDFEMIFVTAFDEDSVKALKFSGAKVLLKPIQIQDLVDAVSSIQKAQGASYLTYQMADGMLRSKFRTIPVITNAGLVFKEVSEILYVVEMDGGCEIYFYDGSHAPSERSLAELVGLLNDKDFEVKNKQLLVNVSLINSLRTNSDNLVFKNGVEVKLD